MAKVRIPMRVWILVFFLLCSVIAIRPAPFASGVQVNSVEPGSDAAAAGLAVGQIVKSVNGVAITDIADFKNEMSKLDVPPQEVTVKTENNTYTYNVTSSIGFSVDANLTVTSVTDAPLKQEEVIKSINGVNFSNSTDFNSFVDKLLPRQVVKIDTNKGQIAFLARGMPNIVVGEAQKTNIRKGLELAGGTRVLLQPVAQNGTITDKDISDIIQVLSNRLNVYGLSDLKIFSSRDWQGNAFIIIEIAGASKEEVKDLIAKQGRFEARIANQTVFVGGNRDITFVCRDDGSCSGIRSCGASSNGGEACKFEFVIHLSPDAARRHANITSALHVITSESGNEILSEYIDFYLDDKMVDSLQIGADLKGSETTSIAISGYGSGIDKQAAIDSALNNMNKLQTILITGSLPLDLEIVKLDSISPVLGKQFVKNSLLVGFVALLAVGLVVFIRYRTFKVVWPMMLTCTSELVIILGFAALVDWNLDTAAIAGIIASIGTGVDAQIIVIDEVMRGQGEHTTNWKQKIKRAFFIIFVSYATVVAGMLPLWNAGAGLVRGFAVITIVGVTSGVFITRPAFAAIVEKLFNK